MSFMLLKFLFMLCVCVVDCAFATVLIKEFYYYYYYYYYLSPGSDRTPTSRLTD